MVNKKMAFTLAEGTSYCTLLPTKVRFGFTLAEVLITLGIIGVVAAMTIPMLLHKFYEQKVVSVLTETQSILSQAIRMAEEEYGDVESWNAEPETAEGAIKIVNNLKPFIKIATDCGVNDTNLKCIPDYLFLRNSNIAPDPFVEDRYYKLVLHNGASVTFRAVNSNDVSIFLYVDINNIAKPNKYGFDVFDFEYGKNALRPLGSPDSTHDSYLTHCLPANATGTGCAYYVLTYKNLDYLRKK